MARTIAALAVASFLAPYLVLIERLLEVLWTHRSTPGPAASDTAVNVTFIVLKIVVAVATIVGIVNLVATTAIILALKALRLHTWRSVLIAGALAGAGLLSLFSAWSSSVPQELGGHALDVINGGIAGILCAALYWTIATGGRRQPTSP